MTKCKICGKQLTEKAMDLHHIFNEAEKKKLSKIRKKKQICSECTIQLIMLNLI
ncbi:MAG: hypothetical protein WC438_05740 [Candidatus Pacearchaeota archaeon]|jgi:ribosomal protein S4E